MKNLPTEAKHYSRVKHLLFIFTIVLDLAIFKVLFLTGQSDAIRNKAFAIFTNPIAANAVYLSLFGLLLYVIHFPLSIFSGFFWEHKFKLSNQNFLQWFKDDFKKNALGFLLMIVLIEIVYIFLSKIGSLWWIWASGFWVLVSVVLAKITPNVIVPLFFKYQAIENKQLKDQVFKIFNDCKVALKDVYMINLSAKTKKANAFLCGLGKNRRVVLSDTLVDHFTPSEIEVVVAHELGHYKHQDIAKFLVIQSGCIFLSFFLIDNAINTVMKKYGYVSMSDIALFPMFVYYLTIINLAIMPLVNWFSRNIEKDADRFSLEVTQSPKDFISLMEKLAKMNLSEIAPNKWIERILFDHPSIESRINFAKTFIEKGASS